MDALGEFWTFVTTAESYWGNRGIVVRVWDHLKLSGFSLLVAAALALPPAIVLGHLKRGGLAAVWVVNIGRVLFTWVETGSGIYTHLSFLRV